MDEGMQAPLQLHRPELFPVLGVVSGTPETARCSPGATQGIQPTTVITSPSSVRRRRTV